MVTEEEKQEIIDKAVEKAMLLLPEVVGNLIAQHVTLSKLNSKFYADHPEFRENKGAVVSVIEMVDSENPGMKYEEILSKAVPRIKERIATTKGLVTEEAKKPGKMDFSHVDISGNGAI